MNWRGWEQEREQDRVKCQNVEKNTVTAIIIGVTRLKKRLREGKRRSFRSRRFRFRLSSTIPCILTEVNRGFPQSNLTFICPCVASVSLKYSQQDATFSRSIYFYKFLYMFQAVPPPIIRSTKLYIQRQVLSNQYCCLLLSWMRWNSMEFDST